MVADYYTKPLQGSQFIRFRDMIMGTSCLGSLAKERVEDSTVSSKTLAQRPKTHGAKRNYKICECAILCLMCRNTFGKSKYVCT